MNKTLLIIAILGLLIIGFVAYKSRSRPQPAQSPQKSETKQTISPTVVIDTNLPSLPEEKDTTPSPVTQTESMKQPPMLIDKSKRYQAVLHTSAGDITIELSADATPITVNNFVYLARQHFYDNTIFHRVIKGFMIQGGDPNGNGTGGPGYRFADEPFTGEYQRGTVAMANAGPNTNGSQFFIIHKDYPLPKNYVIFGKVTAGIDVVDKIAEAPVMPGGEGSTPVTPVKVSSVEVAEQ